jgi:alpha-ketoglutarate-dependent taurine dioxygenase
VLRWKKYLRNEEVDEAVMEDEFNQLRATSSRREEFERRQAQHSEIEHHRVNETDGENPVVCA